MTLAALSRGDGPRTLLGVHGFLANARSLAPLARRLTGARPEWTIRLPELLGHGGSPPLPADAAGLEVLARGILAWMDAEALPRLDAFGHSMGGRVLLKAKSLAPDRLGRLVLLDISPGDLTARPSPLTPTMAALTAAPATASDRRAMQDWLSDRLPIETARWLAQNLHETPDGVTWTLDRARLARLRMDTMPEDVWPAVEAYGEDVLAVHGGRSAYVVDTDVARYRAAGVRVLKLEEAGHFLHIDHMRAVADAIAGFLG